MANEADGSIIIDTEIKKESAIDDIGSLKAALKELTTAVKDLTSGLASSFSSFGNNAQEAASKIDSISDSANNAADSVESLEEQMAKIHVENNTGGSVSGNNLDSETYDRNIEEMMVSNQELADSTRQATSSVEQDFNESEQAPNMLSNAIEMVKNTILGIPTLAKLAGNSIASNFNNGATQATNISDRVDQLKDSLYYLERRGLYFGDKEYDSTYASLKRAEVELENYKRQLIGANREQKNVAKSGKKMNKTLRSTKNEANPLAKSIFKLSNMFKLMVVRMVMRNVIQGVQSGFENLARYSNDTNDAISALISSLTKFKNSIAVAFTPILEVVSPILSKFISMLAEVNNYIGQTMAALAGKDSFVKAVAVQEDYAASLSDTQKAAKEAAKEVKKASFAFDTLIQIQKASNNDNAYKGPTPDQMFETKEVSNKVKELAKDVKKNLSDLFKPIQESWDEYGSTTTSAVRFMLSKLQKLAKDLGTSFIEVWKDEGYGKAITDDLINIIGNFALTIANLANQFDKAWVNAGTGTNIMRHLGDIVLEITGFFREASESISDWAAILDFTPLLTSFDNLLVSLIPIVGKIGDVLLWFLNEILLPLAKWAIENLIPSALDLISSALDVLNSVIDALQPLGNWLWEELLQPLGEWRGEIIIKALKGITKQLKGFSNWIKENQEMIVIATSIVAGFFAAFAFTAFVSGIKSMIRILPSLIDVTRFLWLNFNAISLVLAAIVAIAVYVASAWNKMTPNQKLATTIIAVAGAMALLVAVIAAQLKDFTALLVAGSVAAAAGFALVGIAASANSSAKSSKYPVSSYSSAGYNSVSSVMPRLATGTVVPPRAGEFAAILGDNNKDYEVVSPLETMKQAFKEAIGEMGGVGGGTVKADMIVDGTKFGQLVYKYNKKESDRVGTRMIVNGG